MFERREDEEDYPQSVADSHGLIIAANLLRGGDSASYYFEATKDYKLDPILNTIYLHIKYQIL